MLTPPPLNLWMCPDQSLTPRLCSRRWLWQISTQVFEEIQTSHDLLYGHDILGNGGRERIDLHLGSQVWYRSRFTASVVYPSLVVKRTTFASDMNHRFTVSATYLVPCNYYLFNAQIGIDWELLTESIVVWETVPWRTIASPTWD